MASREKRGVDVAAKVTVVWKTSIRVQPQPLAGDSSSLTRRGLPFLCLERVCGRGLGFPGSPWVLHV